MIASAAASPLRRVLIVEDDQDFADSLADILEPAGFATVAAGNAEEALAALGQSAPQVALVDLHLGLSSGMDVLLRFQAERPNLICVVMTAHADAQSAIEALRRGAYDYFDKTCAPSELLAVLARCFEKLQLQEEREAAYEALRVAKEEAEAGSRTKSDFLATMSHELRTPLNAIIGFSEVMLQEILGPLGNPKYASYAKDIFDSGSHLLSIINDILDLSKAEAGRLELAESEAEVAAAIDAVRRLMRPRAEECGLVFEAYCPADLPLLCADALKVKQMLLNLVSNAIKFTPPGGRVDIAVAVRPQQEFVICVQDTGIGIAEGDIPRVLQPFVQIDSALNRRYSGTGLGLPLVRAMIELHGGELRVESEPGKGTAVSIAFPWARVIERPDLKALKAGNSAGT